MKEDLRFQIDQLKKDRMILLLESVAVSFGFELLFLIYFILFSAPSFAFSLVILILFLGFNLYIVAASILKTCQLRKLAKSIK